MRSALLALFFLFVSSSSALGQNERESLRGWTETQVVVEDFGEDAAEAGLTVDWVEAIVERRLRQAGIKETDDQGATFLYVNVHLLKIVGGYAANVSVSFHQWVETVYQLNPTESMWPTWSKDALIISGPGRIDDQVESSLDQILDRFLNDWGAVNPEAERASQ